MVPSAAVNQARREPVAQRECLRGGRRRGEVERDGRVGRRGGDGRGAAVREEEMFGGVVRRRRREAEAEAGGGRRGGGEAEGGRGARGEHGRRGGGGGGHGGGGGGERVVVRALVRGDQDRHVVRAPLHLQMLHARCVMLMHENSW